MTVPRRATAAPGRVTSASGGVGGRVGAPHDERPTEVRAVAMRIEELLRERPRTFYALVRELGDAEYRIILQAWGSLREARRLGRDAHGLYLLRET